MLTKIKSVLAGISPAHSPETSPAKTPSAVEAQVRKGITNAEVERIKVKLDAARVALTQSERVDADEDSTAVMQRMTRAEEDVRNVEKELTIATKKDSAALSDLKQAEREVASEIEEATRARLRALADRGEELLSSVQQFSEDLAREIQSSRLAGWAVTEIRGQAQLFFGIALHPITGKGHVPSAFMKFRSFGDCLRAHVGEAPRD